MTNISGTLQEQPDPFKASTPQKRLGTLAALALIMLLAGWLRLEATVTTIVDHPIRADAADYVAYAYNLKYFSTYSYDRSHLDERSPQGAPIPDARRAPGYPAFLTLFLNNSPDGRFVLRVLFFQALIGALLIPLTYFIAKVTMPPGWALLPTLLVAISPKLIIAGTYVLTETLFSLALLVSVSWLILQCRHPTARWLPLIGGILLALASLIRPTVQYALPFMLIAMLPMLPKHLRWRQGVYMALGFVLVSLPWILRNIEATGRSSDPTLTINTLVHGHYPDMMYESEPETLGYPYRFDPQAGQLSVSTKAALSGIAERALESPSRYASWYLLGKPVAFLSWADPAAQDGIFTYPTPYSPYFDRPLFHWSKSIMRSSHWFWIILAAFTAIAVFSPRFTRTLPAQSITALRIMATMFLYFVLIHIVGFPIARYCTPLLPILFILAAYGLFSLSCRAMAPSSTTAFKRGIEPCGSLPTGIDKHA